MINQALLRKQLREHEGVEKYPYKDTTGHLTIGVGRNLTDRGLSDDEIEYLLTNDIASATTSARALPFYASLNDVRRMVIIDMVFNLGIFGLRQFRRMMAALYVNDYELAAEEMLDSLWAKQVGKRAHTLARQMRTGVYDEPTK